MHRVPLQGLFLVACLAAIPLLPSLGDAQSGRLPNGTAVPRTIVAAHATGPIRIDGRLNEPAWATATASGNFIQETPYPGAPATFQTLVHVLYDDDAIYVGARLLDPWPDSILAPLTRRDDIDIPTDIFVVMLDGLHDRRTAEFFQVNPRGVLGDGLAIDNATLGTRIDLAWDAVWAGAAQQDSLGWVAEIRIPLSQLQFTPASRGVGDSAATMLWGINFRRYIGRRAEQEFWAPILPDVAGFVSRFGDLLGLAGLRKRQRLQLVPYAAGGLRSAPAAPGDPFHRRYDLAQRVGGDLRFAITSNLAVGATVNPDFSQVEADPAVVNLTAFENFFDERRPFFVDGSDIFRFEIGIPYYRFRNTSFANDRPFYSSRIGRRPHGGVPGDAVFGSEPEATHILAAAKAIGRVGAWNLGVLASQTSRAQARYVDTLGTVHTIGVEPATTFLVGRVLRNMRGGDTQVGSLVTAVLRDPGDARRLALARSAWSGGLDFQHLFARRKYSVSAAVLGTLVTGDTAAVAAVQRAPTHYFQRPDARHLRYDPSRDRLAGLALQTSLIKNGTGWLWGGYLHANTPGFEIDDAGFERAADWITAMAYFGHLRFPPAGAVRSWYAYTNTWAGWSFGGERRSIGNNLDAGFTLRSDWTAFLRIEHEYPALTTEELRGGPALAVPAQNRLLAGLQTDTRKRINASLTISGMNEPASHSVTSSVVARINWRPAPRLTWSIEPAVFGNRLLRQYVAQRVLPNRTVYIFGQLRHTATSLTLRTSYSFTPTMSLQVYAQPFLSVGRLTRFAEARAPRASAYRDRFAEFAPADISYDTTTRTYRVQSPTAPADSFTFADPDFNLRSLSANTVLRWEFRPGSTLFVVWTHSRGASTPVESFSLGRQARLLFAEPATNGLVVRVSYWLAS